jgi:hypothetical protein
MYEQHVRMRISITSWTAPSRPVASSKGYVKEETEGPFWIDSTNPETVANALLRLTDDVRGRDGLDLVVPGGGDARRATSFSVKYDRKLWHEVTASVAVMNAVLAVNVEPKEVKPIHYPTLRPTAYPAGYTRSR